MASLIDMPQVQVKFFLRIVEWKREHGNLGFTIEIFLSDELIWDLMNPLSLLCCCHHLLLGWISSSKPQIYKLYRNISFTAKNLLLVVLITRFIKPSSVSNFSSQKIRYACAINNLKHVFLVKKFSKNEKLMLKPSKKISWSRIRFPLKPSQMAHL